jgi:hypothetical protein
MQQGANYGLDMPQNPSPQKPRGRFGMIFHDQVHDPTTTERNRTAEEIMPASA